MADSYKKANSYLLTENQDLQFIFAKIKKLGEINKKVLSHMDAALAAHCQVANLTGNCLVILASNSSIATQLRFQAPDLLKKLQQDPALKHVKEIQAKVGVPRTQTRLSAPVEKNTHPVERLSEKTSAFILELAKSLDNEKLRKVMEKIAENVWKK